MNKVLLNQSTSSSNTTKTQIYPKPSFDNNTKKREISEVNQLPIKPSKRPNLTIEVPKQPTIPLVPVTQNFQENPKEPENNNIQEINKNQEILKEIENSNQKEVNNNNPQSENTWGVPNFSILQQEKEKNSPSKLSTTPTALQNLDWSSPKTNYTSSNQL